MFAIEEIISSKNCMHIIRQFLYRPDIEKYQAEVVKDSGLSYVTATRCLNTLVLGDFLHESWKGGLKIYKLKSDSPVVKHLKKFFNVAAVYEAVKHFSGQGFELYLYGSAARGEDTEDSDIDIIIIGKIDNRALVEISDGIARDMNRRVNPMVKTPIEFADLSRTNTAFYESIIRDRIRII
ncbi:nucleotidyltransferase domain-containing protein [Methanocella arvoryzae]|uniref:Polymerase nucleotidyl transferase domain-containing protein n=1 Tax=Methanocella arvoryzae (strain DSM 22066 / NBRC 105507 / MRE50) TaxID=351160 RepID=Q0W907_METAR|nr:nucleotidyltransferase domain-containing protein [Methanocella arvoryzae]CAJ35119.1 hypothetical protein LRC97 [Methanocella arvoryzae MRE50]